MATSPGNSNAAWSSPLDVPTSANDDANITTNMDRKKILANQSVRGTSFQKYLAMQKLKKVALVTIAKHLSHEEVGSLEDIFRQVDQAGDGVMSLTEINDAILRGKCLSTGRLYNI